MAQQTTSKYAVQFQIDVGGDDNSSIISNVEYLQHASMEELLDAAHRQLSLHKITDFQITAFMDTDGAELEDDDDVEEAWAHLTYDSDDEDPTESVEPLQFIIKIQLKPVPSEDVNDDNNDDVKIPNDGIDQINPGQSGSDCLSYPVAFQVLMDDVENMFTVHHLEQPTMDEVKQSVIQQLLEEEAMKYEIESIRKKDGKELVKDEDVENAFDGITTPLVLTVVLIERKQS